MVSGALVFSPRCDGRFPSVQFVGDAESFLDAADLEPHIRRGASICYHLCAVSLARARQDLSLIGLIED